jgi:hypothetical protein
MEVKKKKKKPYIIKLNSWPEFRAISSAHENDATHLVCVCKPPFSRTEYHSHVVQLIYPEGAQARWVHQFISGRPHLQYQPHKTNLGMKVHNFLFRPKKKQ